MARAKGSSLEEAVAVLREARLETLHALKGSILVCILNLAQNTSNIRFMACKAKSPQDPFPRAGSLSMICDINPRAIWPIDVRI